MTTYTDTQQALPVQTDVDHGVLVATIQTKSLLYEMAINEIEECILEAMPRAQSALLVDCAELTLHVSSQFLSMLVRVHRKAGESGLKMGICNLSEALQMVYNVTALRSVLPAYHTRQQAVADLGEFDSWERRPISELESEVAKSRPSANRPAGRGQMVGAAGAALATAAILIVAAVLMWLRSSPAVPDQPSFRSSLRGQIAFLENGRRRPDTDSMIVAWPAKLVPDRKISPPQYLQAQAEGWIDIQHGISVGRVNSAGEFTIPTRMDADHTDYHILVVSGAVQSQASIPHHDRMLLSECLTDPQKTLGDRDFTIGRIQIGPTGSARFDWTFTSRQP